MEPHPISFRYIEVILENLISVMCPPETFPFSLGLSLIFTFVVYSIFLSPWSCCCIAVPAGCSHTTWFGISYLFKPEVFSKCKNIKWCHCSVHPVSSLTFCVDFYHCLFKLLYINESSICILQFGIKYCFSARIQDWKVASN